MRTVTVDAEIDLDDVDFDDLLEAVKSRIGNRRGKKDELLEMIISAYEELCCDVELTLPVASLDDQVKMEHLQSVWQDYTAAEIEALLPSKK
jgi:hypothetical protein